MAEIISDTDIRTYVSKLRSDFPILSATAYGKPLVYFDNAATSQKPKQVIDALVDYYSHSNANIHRGVHYLSQKASDLFDNTRVKVQRFINAASEKEIIFTRGTTESINLVAATYGRSFVGKGDEIIISGMEHHSNIVPWQMLCEEKGARLRVIPVTDEGTLDMEAYKNMLSPSVKLVAVVYISNSLGTVNPVKEITSLAHAVNIPVLIDGAQAVAHTPVDVKDIDCDFFAFSGHKMLGPTGTGCLYGKMELLEKMPPYQGGGEMIHAVSFEKTTYNEVPFKFEAGTPNIADVIGMGVAIDYLEQLDRKAISAYEHGLLQQATTILSGIPGVTIYGTAADKSPVISFTIDKINALDAGMFLDTRGIAVRTGHHCTEPLMHRFGIPGTIRASFMFYNTPEEISKMGEVLLEAISFLNR